MAKILPCALSPASLRRATTDRAPPRAWRDLSYVVDVDEGELVGDRPRQIGDRYTITDHVTPQDARRSWPRIWRATGGPVRTA
jgi:hypothetical protein